jgi:hypothetical protein
MLQKCAKLSWGNAEVRLCHAAGAGVGVGAAVAAGAGGEGGGRDDGAAAPTPISELLPLLGPLLGMDWPETDASRWGAASSNPC